MCFLVISFLSTWAMSIQVEFLLKQSVVSFALVHAVTPEISTSRQALSSWDQELKLTAALQTPVREATSALALLVDFIIGNCFGRYARWHL